MPSTKLTQEFLCYHSSHVALTNQTGAFPPCGRLSCVIGIAIFGIFQHVSHEKICAKYFLWDYEYFALTFILHSVQRHASLHPTPTPISLPKMPRWHASASPWLDTRIGGEKWGSVPSNKQRSTFLNLQSCLQSFLPKKISRSKVICHLCTVVIQLLSTTRFLVDPTKCSSSRWSLTGFSSNDLTSGYFPIWFFLSSLLQSSGGLVLAWSVMSSESSVSHYFMFIWIWADTKWLTFRFSRWLSYWKFYWVVRCGGNNLHVFSFLAGQKANCSTRGYFMNGLQFFSTAL